MASLLPNVMLWLLLLGALLLWCGTKDKRRARHWGWIFLLALWLLGTRPVTEVVLWPLESRYIAPNIATLIKSLNSGMNNPDGFYGMEYIPKHAMIYIYKGVRK